MSVFAPIRNYCERTADELWSEPVNALTNASFLIAAWLLWRMYQKNGQKDKPVAFLILLVAIVGTGSTLFHTFANQLTMLADVIPIAVFTFAYLWLALRRLVTLSRFTSAVCLLLFALVAAQMDSIPPPYNFNGSIAYFPCLAALLVIGSVLMLRTHPQASRLLLAALCFSVSLAFRSVDYMVCPVFSIGTHFLWHLLNGLMLYLLVSVFLPVTAPRKVD